MKTDRLIEILDVRTGCLFSAVCVVCLPFLALGSFFAVIGALGALEQATLNSTTEQVEVTILSSRVQESTDGTGGVYSVGSGAPIYTPIVEFSYTIDGELVTSDRVRPVQFSGDQADADALVARYPAGTTATAWLPEADGSLAFLEKSWTVLVYLGVSIGLVVWSFCGGLMVIAGGWRRVRLCWLAAAGLGFSVLGVSLWAIAHGLKVLPPEQGQTMLVLMGSASAITGLLPALGAWQAGRIAKHLATMTHEDLAAHEELDDPDSTDA
ncbi:MAG: hypothetical protein ACI89L_001741 [Phycisphaerales bacterium]|jgi:hypothetical protein